MNNHRRFACLFMLASLIAAVAAHADTSQVATSMTQRASMAIIASAASLERSTVAKEVAINALRNALAVRNDKEEALLNALRAGGPVQIKSAEQTWKKAASDIGDVFDVVRDITERVAQVVSEDAATREDALRVSKSGSDREAGKAVEKAEDHAALAEKYAKKAESLAEPLKRKWLVPPHALAAPVAPSTAHEAVSPASANP